MEGNAKRNVSLPVLLMLWMLLAVLCVSAPAEAKTNSKPVSVKLSKTKVTMLTGQDFTLKATVRPKAAAKSKITWKSSNRKVAKVNAKGKVTLVGVGTAKITASTSNGKKAVCKVVSKNYRLRYAAAGRTLVAVTPEDKKTYHAYSQNDYGYGYYSSYGCVTTAVAIAASAYGKNYSPVDIHMGAATAKYSERYAIVKMGKVDEYKKHFGSAAISLRTASQILSCMGIQNRVVYSFSKPKALKEIRAHLRTGRPVIIKANNTTYNGVRLANLHHAQVLVGLDAKDHAIIINPGNPTFRTSITLSALVNQHMTPASGNYKSAYMTDGTARSAGGYILIDGLK